MRHTSATITSTRIDPAVNQKRIQKRLCRSSFSMSVCCSAGVATMCAALTAVLVADVAVAFEGVGCVADGSVTPADTAGGPTKGRTAVPGVDSDVIVGIDAATSVV